jgi:hypothetical protein
MSIFGRFRRRFDPWSVASIAVLSFCLWMSWQPAAQTSASTRPQPSVTDHTEPVIRAIVDYKVGDAVLADEQRGEHDTSLGTHVDRATWRHLVLKARKVDGSTADVEFLRPAHWLTERHAKVGGTIEVSVPECGIEGQATVLAIHDCPRLQPTPPGYRTVTGTFRHASADILDITVKGQSEPLGTTAVHPFWSEDRQDYVRADELKVGEHLLGDTGPVTITALAPRGSPEPVYNLEVLGDHNYHVTEANLLGHNGTCPLRPVLLGKNMNDRVKPVARAQGFDWYKSKPRGASFDQMEVNNVWWLKGQIKSGRPIYDIGVPKGTAPGRFVEAERNLLHEMGYQMERRGRIKVDDTWYQLFEWVK